MKCKNIGLLCSFKFLNKKKEIHLQLTNELAMNDFIEILKYSAPLIIILIVVFVILRNFSEREKTRLRYEVIRGNNKLLTPVRLQSYERIILLLERIKPESVALRLQNPNMTYKQLQLLILETVRKEFNHNLSQQVYISEETWSAVVNAKEQVIRLINLTGTKMGPESSSNDFIMNLIESYNDLEIRPIENTIRLVKIEAEKFFGM